MFFLMLFGLCLVLLVQTKLREEKKRKKKSRQKPIYFQKIFLFNGHGGELTMCTLPLVFYIKFYFYSMGGGGDFISTCTLFFNVESI